MFSQFLSWKRCSPSLLYFKCQMKKFFREEIFGFFVKKFDQQQFSSLLPMFFLQYCHDTAIFLSLSLSLPSLTAISSRNQILSRREEERNWGKRKRSEKINLILKTKMEFPEAISRMISTSDFREQMPNADVKT